jgi:two-component system, NarL family, sensor kinase
MHQGFHRFQIKSCAPTIELQTGAPMTTLRVINGAGKPNISDAQTGVTKAELVASTYLRRTGSLAGIPTTYLRLILSNLSVGYIKIDHNYIITDANAIAAQWRRLRLEDILNQKFCEVFPNSPMKMLSRAIEDRVFADFQQHSCVWPNKIAEQHIYPFEDGAIIFFREVTPASAQPSPHNTVKLASIDAVSIQIIVLDHEGYVVASNLAWRRFAETQGITTTGAEPINFLTTDLTMFASKSEVARLRRVMKRIIAGHARTSMFEYAWQLKGSTRWFCLKLSRLDNDGKSYVIVENEDITARKAAQLAVDMAGKHFLQMQENDRRRIAQDLHDSTAQHLVAVKIGLVRLKSKCLDHDLIHELEASLAEASAELRSFAYLLYPPNLSNVGLVKMLQQYVKGFESRTGIQVNLKIAGDVEHMALSSQGAIYRIVQEGLANIHQHAAAKHAEIQLMHMRRCLHLTIIDDGQGMSLSPTSGLGLPGIKERVRQLGGSFRVETSSMGTRLKIVLPQEVRSQLIHGGFK